LTGGSITETGGAITVTNLALQAAGNMDFGNPNDVATLAANQTGGTLFSYLALLDLTIGSVDGVNGLHTNSATTMSAPGSITVTNTPAANDIDTNGHSLTVFAATFTNDAGAAIASEGGLISIVADNMTLAAGSSINSGTGELDEVNLLPETLNRPIHLGDAGSASALGLTAAELNTVTAGLFVIGFGGAGDITITAAIAPANAGTFKLESGGGVSQNSAATITAANLAIDVSNAVQLTQTNNVQNLAGFVENSGQGFTFVNAGTLNVGDVGGLGAVRTTNGDISITTLAGDMSVTDDMHAGTGAITLMAAGNLTIAGNITAGGNVDTNAGQNFSVVNSLPFQFTIKSTSGNVETDAGHNFTLPLGATLEADTGTISIGYGYNPGPATADLFGALVGTSASIDGGNGGDTFNINPSATPALTATGGTGSDIFNVTPNALSIITVHGNNPTPPADPGDSLNVALAGTTTPHLSATRTSTGYQGSWTFGNRANVNFDGIETLANETRIAVGSQASDFSGVTPDVSVRDASGTEIAHFLAFDPSASPSPVGGVRIAVGDVNGDGVPDIIVAAGPGFAPEVKVIDGTKLNMVDSHGVIEAAALLADFDAYSPFFRGGVYVAFGLTASIPEIVTGAGPGGGPHVKVIDGTKLNELQPNKEIADSALVGQFYAYSPFFGGGVRVAIADLNGDGVADIVTGAGPGGGPHVKVVDGTKLNDLQSDSEPASSALLGQFYAYSPDFNGGVFVAVSTVGTHPVIVTGAGAQLSGGPNVGPQVKVIDATLLNMLDSNSEPTGSALLGKFFAYNPTSTAGVTVAAADINADGVASIITGGQALSGGSNQPQVKVIDGTKLGDLQPNQEISDTALLDSFFFLFSPGSVGVFVGGQ